MVETKAGRQAVRCQRSSSIVPGDGDLAARAGARFEVGDNAGSMLYPSMMFRLNGIDPEQAGGDAWRAEFPSLDGSRPKPEATHRFPRKGVIVRPQQSADRMAGDLSPSSRVTDGTAINGLEPDDLTRGEIEGPRARAIDAFHFLRTVPGF